MAGVRGQPSGREHHGAGRRPDRHLDQRRARARGWSRPRRARRHPDWTEPGLFTVAPGVHRIPLPLPNDGLRAVNVYAIEAGPYLVLIDAWRGTGRHSAALLDAALGLDSAASSAGITRCLVTHVHRDHYTMAVILRQRFGTHVALGIGDRPSLASAVDQGPGRACSATSGLLRQSGCRVGDPRAQRGHSAAGRNEGQRVGVPGRVAQGPGHIGLEAVSCWRCPLPGTLRGIWCSRTRPARMMFAGDHVLPHITPSVGFEPALADSRSATTSARCGSSWTCRTAAAARARPGERHQPHQGTELLDHH